MMSPLSPALNPALDASAATVPVAATPAADGSDSSPFSALIQGLQPAAGSLPGAGAGTGAIATAQPAPAIVPEAALPASSDPLTAALTSMLQALGLSENSTEPALASQDGLETGSDSDSAGSTDTTDAATTDSSAYASSILSAMPMLTPTAPAIPPATLLASAMLRSSEPVDASAPEAADVQQLLMRQPSIPQAETPQASVPTLQATTSQLSGPIASAMSAANAWLQQPQASFFNMTASSATSPIISESIGLTLGSSALDSSMPTDIPKGMPSAMSFAQTLSGAGSSTSTSVLTTLLPHAVQDPAWSDAFGQRVALLAQQGTQSATLQLNPPELGPIQVRIAMSEQGARVEFNTSQQTTSDLIETAMPRLAAALEQQGLRLDDARVNLAISKQDAFNAQSAFSSARQDTPQGDRGQATPQHAQSSARLPSANAGPEEDSLLGTVIRLPVAQDNGIDYYA